MVFVFHHIYSNQRGLEIAQQQKERVYSNFKFQFEYKDNVVPLNQNEWSTLLEIYKSKEVFQNDDIIFYFHTKSAVNGYNANIEWKELLESELIDKCDFYIDKIKLGFDTAGILMGIPNWSENLYGGNFWYMNARYLKGIEENEYWDTTNRHQAESCFIQSGKNWNPYNNPLISFDNYPYLFNHLTQQAFKKELI